MQSPLENLPIEIQSSIIRLLDPVGLISLSQASRHFRLVVKPTRAHLLERLLELECWPEVGGPLYMFYVPKNTLQPGWEDPAWELMRFSCSGCLHLLHHSRFSTQRILRLAYRKPPPESEDAHALTTWEPCWRGKPEKSAEEERQEANMRQRYDFAVRPRQRLNWDERFDVIKSMDFESFRDLTIDVYEEISDDTEQRMFDHEIRLIENKRCGYKRHARICIECHFQNNTPLPSSIGPLTQLQLSPPILLSRLVPFTISFDRWLPGLPEALGIQRPHYTLQSLPEHRKNKLQNLYPLHMARCPRCATWQEIRAFRQGNDHLFMDPKHGLVGEVEAEKLEDGKYHMVNLCCHHCTVKEDRTERLAVTMVKWAQGIISRDIQTIQRKLLAWRPHEWRLICQLWSTGCVHLNNAPKDKIPINAKYKNMPEPYRTEAAELQKCISALESRENEDWTAEDVRTVGRARVRWAELLEHRDESKEPRFGIPSLASCEEVEKFEKCEELWTWLTHLREEIGGRGNELVKWALERRRDALT